jgi:predicted HTH domain antitoxin
MQVVLNIPDEMARNLAANGEGLSRAALEALALEGYRTERLSESEVRRLLGFETRMQVHGFLKEHGCYLHYSVDDLERDHEISLRLRAKRQADTDDPAKTTE